MKTRTIPVDVLPRPIPGTTSAEEKAAKDVRVGCNPAAGRTEPSLFTALEAIRENMLIIEGDIADGRRPPLLTKRNQFVQIAAFVTSK